MKNKILACLAVPALLAFANCSGPTTHAQRDAATGAALGALGGAVIGNNVGDGNAARGAAIGAAVGGGAGYLHGKNKDQQGY